MKKKLARMAAQFAVRIIAHAPQAAIGFDKKAVSTTAGNGHHIAGNHLGHVCIKIIAADAQLTGKIGAYGPEGAIGKYKETVIISGGDSDDII
jgi:hypothetical protein